MCPHLVSDEHFKELIEHGWEWEPDEQDGLGSFHFMIVMNEGHQESSGIGMDFIVNSKEAGLLFYSEFVINKNGAKIDHAEKNSGQPCLLKDLTRFVRPYIMRADKELEINTIWLEAGLKKNRI